MSGVIGASGTVEFWNMDSSSRTGRPAGLGGLEPDTRIAALWTESEYRR
ncbi:hypothetical protein [Streptomyces sp. NRRL S-1521]|nr:hypothetical protein [Streptomyces sp. NRRL S-1521]